MTWKLERLNSLQSAVGAVASEMFYSESSSPTLNRAPRLVYDSKYLWLVVGNKTAIFDFWGHFTNDEPSYNDFDGLDTEHAMTVNEYNIAGRKLLFKYDGIIASGVVIDEICSINTVGSIVGIDKTANQIVKIDFALTDRINFDQPYDGTPLANYITVTKFNNPYDTINSNIAFDGSKVWYATKVIDTEDRQKLCSLDLSTGVFSYSFIHGKRQDAKRQIVVNNSKVYVANYNDFNISTYDLTGAYLVNLDFNGYPTVGASNYDLSTWFSSYAGMFSKIDSADVVSNDWSTESRIVKGGFTTTNEFWYIDQKFARLHKMYIDTNQIFDVFVPAPPTEDEPEPNPLPTEEWEVWHEKIENTHMFIEMCTIPHFTYTKVTDSGEEEISVGPYVAFVGVEQGGNTEPQEQDPNNSSDTIRDDTTIYPSSRLFMIDSSKKFYRDLAITVEGQAMVSKGIDDNTGESQGVNT